MRLPVISLVLPVAFAACGLINNRSNSSSTTTGSATASTGTAPATSSGAASTSASGAGDAEVRALVTEALTPQMCPRLLGSFIGLPGEGTARGPAAGTLPSAGRWWIRTCTARVTGERLELSLGGPGWIWIDRETSGFRVRQYLLLEAQASLGADVSVGYDRPHRIASIWMTPAEGVQATITPRGVVSAEPTGFFSTILGGVAAATGNSVSDRARTQAGEMGSTMLREKLGAGFTMTFSLDTRQIDFMVGALSRGEVPERPFPNTTHAPWMVNQRSMVWPGGVDVIGPLDASQGRLGMDIALEEGDGATVKAVCSEPLTRYFDARFRDPNATPPAPNGTTVVELSAGSAQTHVTLPDTLPGGPCPMLLMVSPRGANLPARLRYRIAPEPPEAANTAPSQPRRVRLQIVGATVSHENPSGHAWDLVGGEADLVVVTASVPLGRQIDATPLQADHDNATWNRWLPGAFEANRDLPLRFSVFDDDTTSRELIGTADLDVAHLPAATGDLSLPVRSTGTVPTQTGTLRLRVEVLP